MEEKKVLTIRIAQRPWYEWILWALWAFVEIFMLQNAIASSREFEPTAATIFWLTFVVLLLAGGAVWLVRRAKLLT